MSQDTRSVIAKGSKSFYLASLFFSSVTREACWVLYRWCRYCDDQIDHGGSAETLEELRQLTRDGIRLQQGPAIFCELGQVFARYRIPEVYAEELLNGFEKDIQGIHIQTLRDLEEYAFQVAGVVGLMMSYIMGAPMPLAEQQAKSLGNAMQLTNIARDVLEDYQRGRIYLPQEWLRGINTDRFMDDSQRERVFAVVEKLLLRADELYREGYRGLRYLPWRAAMAVSIAGSVYSAIGRKIRKLGPQALRERVIISLPLKLLLSVQGIWRVMWRSPERFAARRVYAKPY